MGLRAKKQMTGTDGHEERLLPLEKVQLGATKSPQRVTEPR